MFKSLKNRLKIEISPTTPRWESYRSTKFVYGILGAIGLVFCLQSSADELISRKASVNIEVYSDGALHALDAGQARVNQILNFIENSIYPTLPSDIAQALGKHPLKLFLKESATSDEFFEPSPSDPNELHISLRPSVLMSEDAFALIAHAYFHAVHYLIHPDPDQKTWEDELWLREGMAQVFEYLVLHRLNSAHVIAALTQNKTPLMGHYSGSRLNAEQYGHDLLYFFYLFNQCGGTPLFWSLARGETGKYGPNTVEFALKSIRVQAPQFGEKEQCSSFEASASSFEIARVLNKKSYTSAERERYYLLSQTLPPPLARISADSQVISAIQKSERYQPFLFQGEVELPNSESEGMLHYWIQNQFPYQVQDSRPASAKGWMQLLFKP